MFTYFKACIFLEYVSLGSGIDNILVTFFNVKFKFSFFQSYPYWQFFKGPSLFELSPVFPRPPSDAQLLTMVWVNSEVRAADAQLLTMVWVNSELRAADERQLLWSWEGSSSTHTVFKSLVKVFKLGSHNRKRQQ